MKHYVTKDEIVDALLLAETVEEAATMLNIPKRTLYSLRQKFGLLNDPEIVAANAKLARQTQKSQDKNRIANKTFRENARQTNAFEEFNEAIVQAIGKLPRENIPFKGFEIINDECVGIIQLTDYHFNEQVDLPHNKYNWKIAGQRLKKHVDESIRFFKSHNVQKVVFAMTGDLTNSTRRLDEVLENSTNLANCVVLAYDLIRKAVDDVASEFRKVHILSAWGNESRLDKDIGYINALASNNFDSTIYKLLKIYYEGFPDSINNIRFVDEGLEVLLEIAGKNVLFLHGHTYGPDLEKSTVKIKAKYASKGVIIDYIISGHIHSPFISGYFARAGSGTGDNNFNFNALHIAGRASQNAFIFEKNGNRQGLMIDLQEIDNIVGYEFCKALESYNSKSDKKCHKEETIFKIVI